VCCTLQKSLTNALFIAPHTAQRCLNSSAIIGIAAKAKPRLAARGANQQRISAIGCTQCALTT
jgi:hypothetical protein